jgi:hypothetical protein
MLGHCSFCLLTAAKCRATDECAAATGRRTRRPTMLPQALRTKPEAMLPQAARRSCGHSLPVCCWVSLPVPVTGFDGQIGNTEALS